MESGQAVDKLRFRRVSSFAAKQTGSGLGGACMRTDLYRALLYLSLSRLLALFSSTARAATCLPLSDGDLARCSPLIVRAEVLSQETRLESEGDQELVCTLTTFRVLEFLKGRLSSD